METTTKVQMSFKKFPTYKTLQIHLEDSKHGNSKKKILFIEQIPSIL